MHLTVEKIGGTSMSQYTAVRDNIILGENQKSSHRIIVVSAYAGITNLLLEHKKNGDLGVYGMFAANQELGGWQKALQTVRQAVHAINVSLFEDEALVLRADQFINARIDTTEQCLGNLQRLCEHGHFSLGQHLQTVREMLASLGEAHSAWNMVQLLQRDGVDTALVDLTGWDNNTPLDLDDHLQQEFAKVDYTQKILVATGYSHCKGGLMATFDRGYSEMTFSRIAVVTQAGEALIHKEYHLSSADPSVVDPSKVVPIGRTNYDVADQLANLGMEAIHPKAANGLRKNGIPLRVKNTFEPEHNGTLITESYISENPRVEIIAGRKNVYAVSVFDQDMVGDFDNYENTVAKACQRFRTKVITKDVNANSITYYVSENIKNIKRIESILNETLPSATIGVRKVAIVSAIGSDMQVPGILAKAGGSLADAGISILAVHQCMRQVDIQFIIEEDHYNLAVQSLHQCLIEVHKHKVAICAA